MSNIDTVKLEKLEKDIDCLNALIDNVIQEAKSRGKETQKLLDILKMINAELKKVEGFYDS